MIGLDDKVGQNSPKTEQKDKEVENGRKKKKVRWPVPKPCL